MRQSTIFRAGLVALVSLLFVAAAPGPVTGQVRLVPQVGLYAPQSDLPSADEAVEVGERESTLAFGLGLEIGSAEGTALRIAALHGTGEEVPVDGVGCTECARSTVSALPALAVLRPIPKLVVFHPYLLAGGGVRRLDFSREDLAEEQFDALFADETTFAGHLGVGGALDLGPLDLSVEVTDVISSFESPEGESELLHDLFVMVGLSIG